MSLKTIYRGVEFVLVIGLVVALMIWINKAFNGNASEDVKIRAYHTMLEESLLDNIDLGRQIPLRVHGLVHDTTLVYRYLYLMCHSCYEQDLYDLKDFQKRIGSEKVMVLPYYPNNRNDIVRMKNELTDFRFINTPTDSLPIPKNESDIERRYFAVITPKGEITMLFFPNILYPQLTQKYFERVAKMFGLSYQSE